MNLNRPLQIQRQRQIQRQLRPPKKSTRPLQVQRQRQIQGQLRPPKKKQAAATNSKTTSNSKTTAPRYGLPLLGWKYSGAVAAGTACRAPTDARGCGERHLPRLPRPASFTCPENCG